MRKQVIGAVFLVMLLCLGAAAWGAAPAASPHGAAGATVEAKEGASKDMVAQELNGWQGTLVVTIIIFICLFLVLSKTAWKPIMSGLKSREQSIRDSIEAAKRAKEDAERTTKELEAKMAEVQRQASQQLQLAKSDAVKIADTIRAQAETESAAAQGPHAARNRCGQAAGAFGNQYPCRGTGHSGGAEDLAAQCDGG